MIMHPCGSESMPRSKLNVPGTAPGVFLGSGVRRSPFARLVSDWNSELAIDSNRPSVQPFLNLVFIEPTRGTLARTAHTPPPLIRRSHCSRGHV